MKNPRAYGWDWNRFKGTPEGLKWNYRDLSTLDAVMKMTLGRTAVVQAGGNLGIFPKRLAQEFKAVYTFEPDSKCFEKLMANAPEHNIVKFQAALGCDRVLVSTSGTRRDNKPVRHEGITHVAGDGIIPTIAIDDLGLQVCDLIYLDLEGYELFALRGGKETIARCRPVVVSEINKCIGFVGFTEDDVRRCILDQGYRFVKKMHSDEIFVPQETSA